MKVFINLLSFTFAAYFVSSGFEANANPDAKRTIKKIEKGIEEAVGHLEKNTIGDPALESQEVVLAGLQELVRLQKKQAQSQSGNKSDEEQNKSKEKPPKQENKPSQNSQKNKISQRQQQGLGQTANKTATDPAKVSTAGGGHSSDSGATGEVDDTGFNAKLPEDAREDVLNEVGKQLGGEYRQLIEHYYIQINNNK